MSIATSSDIAPDPDTICGVAGDDAPQHLRAHIETLLRIGFDVTPTGCWEYRGAKNHNGYGVVNVRGKGTRRAHRVMYEYIAGPFPEDRPLARHRCDNPPCVNPAHIVPGTHEDNMADMVERGRSVRSHTHCPANHVYTDENVSWRARAGKMIRECRECIRARQRRYRARKRAS